jgi:hypothetical protein
VIDVCATRLLWETGGTEYASLQINLTNGG